MTDDLVKRLRAIDKDIILRRFDPEMSFDGMTAHKAANRIEKLETALTHIYAWYPVSIFNPHQTIKEIKEFACKALEGKDD